MKEILVLVSNHKIKEKKSLSRLEKQNFHKNFSDNKYKQNQMYSLIPALYATIDQARDWPHCLHHITLFVI